MEEQHIQLSPPTTSCPFTPLEDSSPEELEAIFGKLDRHKYHLHCIAHFGFRPLAKRKVKERHYWLGNYAAAHFAPILWIRDVQGIHDRFREKDEDGNPIGPDRDFVSNACKLTHLDLRYILGQEIYEELRQDHRNSPVGIAIQAMEAAKAIEEEHERRKKRTGIQRYVRSQGDLQQLDQGDEAPPSAQPA